MPLPSARKLRRWLIELTIVVLVVTAINLWRESSLASGAAPPLQAVTVSGKPFTLAGADRPTLVYFWGTWCPICKLTSPNVAAVAQDHRVITVAMQSGSDVELRHFLQEHGLEMPVINDDSGIIAGQWGVNSVPALFFINLHGKIEATTIGFTSGWSLRLRLWLAGTV